MSEEWPDHTKITGEQFVVLSQAYFRKPMITLHEGICLLRKYNPEVHDEVGTNLDTDRDSTARPYMFALEALKNLQEVQFDFHGDRKKYKLELLKENPEFQEGKRYVVRTRAFVAWVIQTWPPCIHFQLAESAYLEAKKEKTAKKKWVQGSAVKTSNVIREYLKKYFVQNEIDPSNYEFQASKWAKEIRSMILLDYDHFPGDQTIRKRISEMVESGEWDELVKEVNELK